MLTGKFRASYAQVWEPKVPKGSTKPKYSISMLFPKSDTVSINQIWAEIEKVKQTELAQLCGGRLPAQPRITFYDGDGISNSGETFGEECRGHMILRASADYQPGIVDINTAPIINRAEFYSGCYARASINFYAYDINGNKGIGCGLNNIQKLADGEPFSGRTSAEEDFGGANAYAGGGIPAGYPQNYGQPGPTYQEQTQQPYQQPAYQAPVTPAYTQPAAPVMQPGYGQPVPTQQPYQAPTQQPYQQPMQGGYPPVQQQAPAFDPITGMPIVSGGVMGI